MSIPVSNGAELKLETAIRWTSGLRGNGPAPAGLGLAANNNARARRDIPARNKFTFRF